MVAQRLRSSIGGILLGAMMLAAAGSGAWGAPLANQKVVVTQPDGTRLELRGWGDEFYRVIETVDGYTVIDVAGWWQYARLNEAGTEFVATGAIVGAADPAGLGLAKHLRLTAASQKSKALSARTVLAERKQRRVSQLRSVLGDRSVSAELSTGGQVTTGTRKSVTILVNFPEESSNLTSGQVENFSNQVGYTEFGNVGSAHDYFYAMSNGRLNYSCDVRPFITVTHAKSYYDDKSNATGAQDLVTEALNAVKAAGFDFSQLDGNSDGIIDGINLFYAGEAGSDNLWPHQSTIEFSSNGVSAKNYQMTNLGSQLTLYTFCHENGHMLCEFNDLYDYGYDSSGVGQFCLMCTSINETRPQFVCAYLRYRAGWLDAREISSGSYTVTSGGADALLYRNSGNSNEYFIIENRYKSGYDLDIPVSGLAVWHVDQLGSNDNQQRTLASHYECTLVQADGRWDLESQASNPGDATDLYSASVNASLSDSTTPNSTWWDSSASGLKLSSISAPGTSMTLVAGDGSGSNHAPVAADQSVSTAADTAVAITLTGTDADGDTLFYTVNAYPAHGTLSGSAPILTYTPSSGFTGTDTLTFSIVDIKGSSSNTATVTITVGSSSDPVAQFVTRFYQLCLLREPDSTGLNAWVANLKSGASTGADVGTGFIFSAEFQARNLSNSDWLDVLYQAFFNRAADAGGKSSWLTQMDGGTSKQTVLDGFTHGQEFINLCSTYGITPYSGYVDPVSQFVTRFYQLCLLRDPDTTGLNAWVANLKSGASTGADVGAGFIFSSEFQARNLSNSDWLDVLYQAFFNRAADAGGKSSWLTQMDAGTSKQAVLDGFTHGAEFATLCSQYGINPY